MWLVGAAFAGSVFINGTLVEPRSVAGVTLSGASVKFDDQGNVHVTAPGYQIRVAPPSGLVPAPKPQPGPAVAYGRWWLVTEDKASSGHAVDVVVNGTRAFTIRSGEGDKLFELSKWLRLGSNLVVVKAVSSNPGGGTLTLFMGAGGSEKGFFDMPKPQLEFGAGPSTAGASQREYTVLVDR